MVSPGKPAAELRESPVAAGVPSPPTPGYARRGFPARRGVAPRQEMPAERKRPCSQGNGLAIRHPARADAGAPRDGQAGEPRAIQRQRETD
jgi:hypothetical protein